MGAINGILMGVYAVVPATNQIKQFGQKFYKSGELFNKLFCKNKILLSSMRQ